MLNQNKRAVTLNLKHPRGRELLFEMVRRADVLLENFSPGTMDDLGVGWSVLHEINPRLIYATGTGFGISGPDRDNLAMDLTIQAASGIMSVTGAPDGPPMKAGPTLVDFMGGIHLYGAILTALYERDRSGEGRLVEVAMQETVYSSLAASFEYYHRTGQPPPRTGNRQAGLSTRALQRLPDHRRPCRDPRRHRGALEEPDRRRWGARNWPTTRASPPTPTASPIWTRPTPSSREWTRTLPRWRSSPAPRPAASRARRCAPRPR